MTRDYWREIVGALRPQLTEYDEVTIDTPEMLAKYRGEYPDARVGTTLRIRKPAKLEPSR